MIYHVSTNCYLMLSNVFSLRSLVDLDAIDFHFHWHPLVLWQLWSKVAFIHSQMEVPKLFGQSTDLILLGPSFLPEKHAESGQHLRWLYSFHSTMFQGEHVHVNQIIFRFLWKTYCKDPILANITIKQISPSANITTENMSWWWYLSEKLSDDIIQDLKISSS